MQGSCVKCKEKREIKDPVRVTMKNSRPAMSKTIRLEWARRAAGHVTHRLMWDAIVDAGAVTGMQG